MASAEKNVKILNQKIPYYFSDFGGIEKNIQFQDQPVFPV